MKRLLIALLLLSGLWPACAAEDLGIFSDQSVYTLAVNQFKAIANSRNLNERLYWANRCDAWVLNSEVLAGLKKPLPDKPAPPALLMKVLAAAGGSDQNRIVIEFGPELVSDSTCELPVRVNPTYPAGVTHVRQYEGWGDTWSAFPDDTMVEGSVIDFVDPKLGPIRLTKVEHVGWGGLRVSFYNKVK
jgi:hypothetical protein